jgi:hypothetical protein
MILFAVSTLSYTDTRTIGWPFLITIPAISAASAVAYDRFVCLSTWSKNRPTSGRLLCESTSCTISGAGSSASRSLITRVAIRCTNGGVKSICNYRAARMPWGVILQPKCPANVCKRCSMWSSFPPPRLGECRHRGLARRLSGPAEFADHPTMSSASAAQQRRSCRRTRAAIATVTE